MRLDQTFEHLLQKGWFSAVERPENPTTFLSCFFDHFFYLLVEACIIRKLYSQISNCFKPFNNFFKVPSEIFSAILLFFVLPISNNLELFAIEFHIIFLCPVVQFLDFLLQTLYILFGVHPLFDLGVININQSIYVQVLSYV